MDILSTVWQWAENFASWVASPTAESWTAIGTWLTVAVAGIAANAAFRQIKLARELRVTEAQPYVVASMEQNANEPLAFDFVIRNYGKTAATDIRISAEPNLRWTLPDGPEELFMPDVIPTLAPGQEWRNVWDYGPARLPHHEMKDENRHVVKVEYLGIDRAALKSEAILDWRAYQEISVANRLGTSDAAQALVNISDRLNAWGPQDGLTVHPVDRDAVIREQLHRYREDEAQRGNASSGETPPPESHLG